MSEKLLTKQILLSSNYWALNKSVVKEFGIETAFLLTNLAEAENMMADEEGWFYQTSDTLEELTTLSRYKQDKCIEELEKAGVLEKDIRGIPAKRYFRLDYKTLANKIAKNSQTSVKEIDKQELKKLTTNKESTNKQSTKESKSNGTSPKKTKYGDAENVLLTDEEYKKLKDRFPSDYKERINNLSYYIASKGAKYKSHYMTILAWARKEKPKENKQKNWEKFID